VTIETQTGMKLVTDMTGITITNGQGASIKLQLTTVAINETALEVS